MDKKKEEAVGSGPVSRHAQELRQKEAQRNQHKIAAGRDKRELQDLHIGEGMLALQNGRENEHRIRDVDEQPGQMTVGVLVHEFPPRGQIADRERQKKDDHLVDERAVIHVGSLLRLPETVRAGGKAVFFRQLPAVCPEALACEVAAVVLVVQARSVVLHKHHIGVEEFGLFGIDDVQRRELLVFIRERVHGAGELVVLFVQRIDAGLKRLVVLLQLFKLGFLRRHVVLGLIDGALSLIDRALEGLDLILLLTQLVVCGVQLSRKQRDLVLHGGQLLLPLGQIGFARAQGVFLPRRVKQLITGRAQRTGGDQADDDEGRDQLFGTAALDDHLRCRHGFGGGRLWRQLHGRAELAGRQRTALDGQLRIPVRRKFGVERTFPAEQFTVGNRTPAFDAGGHGVSSIPAESTFFYHTI